MSAIRASAGETITAVMNTPMPPGDEHYGPPLTIGFYDGCEEVWVQGQHGRVQIPAVHLAAVNKELRHAAQASKESVNEG